MKKGTTKGKIQFFGFMFTNSCGEVKIVKPTDYVKKEIENHLNKKK